MNKILSILLFLIFQFSFAQTHRFIYEYKYKLDSTKADFEKYEMVLDVNPNETKFYEHGFLASDSLNVLHGNISNQYTSQTEQTLMRPKNSFKNKNYLQIWMMPFYYVLETNDEMKWKISNETKKENGYHLQKATTYFGGRHWIAWFTTDIPISEGPYKFRGLPGLIMNIEDDKQNFIYTFSRNKNLPKTFDTKTFVENHYSMNAIPVTEKAWVKLKMDFYNDPYSRMRTDFQPDWTVKINGRQIKNKDEFNELKPAMQKNIRNYYANPIELDKAIKY